MDREDRMDSGNRGPSGFVPEPGRSHEDPPTTDDPGAIETSKGEISINIDILVGKISMAGWWPCGTRRL